MEKEFGSLFPYQQLELQSSNANFAIDGQTFAPTYLNPYMNEVSANGAFPCSGLPPSKVGQLSEPGNWFYCLPRSRQAFLPPSPSKPKEILCSGLSNYGTIGSAGAGAGAAPTQKGFLVFDQSGDQTTLLYSAGIGTPIGGLSSWKPDPPFSYSAVKEGLDGNANSQFLPFRNLDLYQGCQKDGTSSEMHEDTEELNALLYSDDENYYSEDDEVTSTDHSPSTMTDHGIHHLSEEVDEEVASSAGSTKRQKLLNGTRNVLPLVPAIGSKKLLSCDFEDDAESCCGNFDDQISSESLSLSGRKRSKKEKIQKTVRLLQKMIPGAEGKDAIGVIDEAVHYLKSIREKAQSLHFDVL